MTGPAEEPRGGGLNAGGLWGYDCRGPIADRAARLSA